jgi:[ribosomal protein S18]-alanine N-acetyltransferase
MVRVRQAVPQDLSRMMEIAQHSVQASHWPRDAYERLFAAPELNRVVLVVEASLTPASAGEVLGFIVARKIDSEWEIENIAVTGPARRRGLGSRLMGEFLKLVREQGGKTVFLEVRESNVAANNLYQKWGFLETGRRKSYYLNPAEDALILSFSFPSEG